MHIHQIHAYLSVMTKGFNKEIRRQQPKKMDIEKLFEGSV